MAAPARKRLVVIPQFGTVNGGLLDGWSFALVHVGYGARGHFIDLRVAEPGWPFTKVVRFHKGDLYNLRAATGAPRYDAQTLFDAAQDAATGTKNVH